MRPAIVAGQFYQGTKDGLLKEIKDCFLDKDFGPGGLPDEKKKTGKILGGIAPHAGYGFSGMCQSFVYKAIAEGECPKTIVILGTNHTSTQCCISDEDWETPLGVVKTDDDLAKEISKCAKIEISNEVHYSEHSIEVQLPFIQFCFGDKVKIVAIMIGQNVDTTNVAKGIIKAIEGKDVCVVASSDFTHFGYNYGYMPFRTDEKKNMEKLDRGAIDYILDKNAKGFMEYIEKTGATICGMFAIAVLIEIFKKNTVKLLQYYTSADVIGDYSNAVGYGAIIFK